MEPENDRKFWLPTIGATLLLAAVVLLFMFRRDYVAPGDSFRLEAAKLVLQFLLVGVAGTLVVASLNQRRDRAEKAAASRAAAEERAAARKAAAEKDAADARSAARERAAVRRAALQELIRQIGDAHRRLKVVKRQMRATIARLEPEPVGPPERPYRIPAAAFERGMEALLNAQIAAEEVRDRIAMSIDLLGPDQIARIRGALRYGVRYFHDAYEDYEHGRIKREAEHFLITPACDNLHNFLFAREPPADLPPGDADELRVQFATMHEEGRDLAQRYAALERIEALRKRDGKRKRRYRAVATECFALAADELRLALWSTCPADPPAGTADTGEESAGEPPAD